MKPLTGSGAGVTIEQKELPDGMKQKVDQLKQLIRTFKFVVIPGFSEKLDDALELLAGFGPVNYSPTRDKGVLTLNAETEDEVLRSHEALPLHKDGLLTEYDVRLVGIYCMQFRNVNGGRTYISDTSAAILEMPEDHMELLKERGFEGIPVDDTGYYAKSTADWHAFPAFVPDAEGKPSLHIGMPHLPGERESWKVRLPGLSEAESNAVFFDMIRLFSNAPYVYYHSWKEGDIILMDNYKVLHGRERFSGGPRELANIQVLAEDNGT